MIPGADRLIHAADRAIECAVPAEPCEDQNVEGSTEAVDGDMSVMPQISEIDVDEDWGDL